MKKIIVSVLSYIFCLAVLGFAAYNFMKGNRFGLPDGRKGSSSFYEEDDGMDEAELKNFKFKSDDSGESWFVTGYEGNLGEIIIPSGYKGKPVTGIGDGAFSDKAFLREIRLPDGIKFIGKKAFSGCKALKEINFPEKLTEIGGYAFKGCGELVYVRLPHGLKKIGSHAFEDCLKLTGAEIPENVTRIDDYTFSGCIALKRVIIYGGLTEIGDFAFMHCPRLNEIVAAVMPEAISDKAFDGKISVIILGNHDYEEIEHKDPGCTQNGYIKKRCIHCGEEITETLFAKGHKWDEGKVKKEPTCAETGCIEYTCLVCGEKRTEDLPLSDNHDYGSWIEEVPATEIKEGIKGHYHCSRCGKDFDAEYNVLYCLVIPVVFPDTPEVGETMTFGNYHGATEWTVLDKDEEKTLIIAKDIIDAKPYNEWDTDITWENCTLRKWLNDGYINEAFTETEKSRIFKAHLVNKNHPAVGTPGGSDTDDKVFLLSYDESCRYFPYTSERAACGTGYAKENNLDVNSDPDSKQWYGYSSWWLRSPGSESDHAAFINYSGSNNSSASVSLCKGVRPVLYIMNVSSCSHKWDSGKVTKEPSCTANGVRTYTCLVCGRTWTEEIPKKEHDFGDWMPEVPATEKEDGVKGHYHCSSCGRDYDGGYNVLESLVIPKIAPIAIPEVGETMTFGNYHGATEWTVLVKEADRALIVAKDITDAKPYNKWETDITWENCTLRSWLNNEYINEAFSEGERSRILTAHVVNKDHGSTPGGNDTEDKIFLLSYSEVKKYFPDDAARRAKSTDYAKNHGLWTAGSSHSHSGCSCWWLRSPGSGPDSASVVDFDGSVDFCYDDVESVDCGVRPALYIMDQGHTWDEGVVTRSPACTENGVRTYTCTVCGMTRTEEIPALGHKYGRWTEEVPATETKEGIKGHYHCNRCGKDFDGGYNVLESLVIPKIVSIVIPEVGETMTFGNYHGATEWTVLDKKEGKTLIVAKDIIDAKPYNEQKVDITWENCTLRSWLNNEYINEAFSAEERKRILTTHVNNNNPSYSFESSNDTEDKVFLLSREEVKKYFVSNVAGRAKGTDYAKRNGLWLYNYSNYYPQDCGYGDWWLRSPGYDSDCSSLVDYDGIINYNGEVCIYCGNAFHDPEYYYFCIDSSDCGVRPALWICNQAFHIHSWDEGDVTWEPTCTETGLRTYTCTICDETKTEEIPALGHNLSEWIEEVPATNTKESIPGHYHCNCCGKDFDALYNELKSPDIPAGDHDLGKLLHNAEEATKKCPYKLVVGEKLTSRISNSEMQKDFTEAGLDSYIFNTPPYIHDGRNYCCETHTDKGIRVNITYYDDVLYLFVDNIGRIKCGLTAEQEEMTFDISGGSLFVSADDFETIQSCKEDGREKYICSGLKESSKKALEQKMTKKFDGILKYIKRWYAFDDFEFRYEITDCSLSVKLSGGKYKSAELKCAERCEMVLEDMDPVYLIVTSDSVFNYGYDNILKVAQPENPDQYEEMTSDQFYEALAGAIIL